MGGPAPVERLSSMMMPGAPPLVLASGSSARRALLSAAGLVFTILPADVDEAAIKRDARAEGRSLGDTALLLAEAKAASVAAAHPDALVIGADQMLVCGEAWFDKPADLPAARAQLLALCGRTHTLATAVVCHWQGRVAWRHLATPHLTMRGFSDAFLDAYLQAEAAFVTTSVGAYRLEGPGLQLFAAVEGEHSAILGLPMLALLDFLRRQGVAPG